MQRPSKKISKKKLSDSESQTAVVALGESLKNKILKIIEKTDTTVQPKIRWLSDGKD
ncbi:hypothetical protein HN954_02500 [bacterium]|jgi:hypothetical protein|nr:hypothetical protein [bacterium]MBT6831630.1 hypothetical protein [bacterium]MBT6996276.1 hypothetical protein [bacterium]MBT7772954.1 hypothetical protein [bacterium]